MTQIIHSWPRADYVAQDPGHINYSCSCKNQWPSKDNCFDRIALYNIVGVEIIKDTRGTLTYVNGLRAHREDGPAVIDVSGYKEYWLNGIKLTKKEFLSRQKDTIHWPALMAQELGQKENN